MKKKIFLLLFHFLFFVQIKAQTEVLNAYNQFNIKISNEVVISPDGKFVAYTVITPKGFLEAYGSSNMILCLLNLSTNESKQLIVGQHSANHLTWSNNSEEVFFISRLNSASNNQLYSVDIKTFEVKTILENETSILNYSMHPEGKSVIFIAATNEPANPLYPNGYNFEVYEEDFVHENLYLYNFSSKNITQLTENITVTDAQWNPQGTAIALQAVEKNLTDYIYMFKEIFLLQPETKTLSLVVEKHGKLGKMCWSPNGDKLAFLSGENINDPAVSSLFVLNFKDKKTFAELPNLTKNFEGTVTNVEWLNNNTLIYSSDESTLTTLRKMDIENANNNELLLAGGEVIFTNFTTSENVVTFSGNTPQIPGDVYSYNLRNKQLTKHTTVNTWLQNLKFAKQNSITYTAADGVKIEGVLIYPINYVEGKQYPLIVYVHGGPEACVLNGWTTNYGSWAQIAAAEDYFVFMPNYRGSTGRGVAFSKLDYGKPLQEEFDDILNGIDYLNSLNLIDIERVGIGGGSYGGYFAAWGATKESEHFAASVVFVGVSNQISKRNTTDIAWEDYYVHFGYWNINDFEKAYEASPIKYADNSQTPTLILHGKEDQRIPPSQGLELYRSLKMHGKAPVRLVYYPGQGHGNRTTPSRLDFTLRTMAWFNFYLKGNNPTNLMPPKDIEYEITHD